MRILAYISRQHRGISGILLVTLIAHQSPFGISRIAKANPQESKLELTRNKPTISKLLPIKPVARSMKGGEVHTYTVYGEAQQFLEVIAEQKSIDIVLTLIDPDGKVLVEADQILADYEPEHILQILPKSGEYHVEVKPYDKQVPLGFYTIHRASLRPVTAADKDLIKAYENYNEVLQLKLQGRIVDTIEPAEHAVKLFEKTLGPNHLMTGKALNLLGEMYGRINDYSRAETSSQRALTIFQRSSPPARPHIARALNNLAILENEKGQYEKALHLYQSAFEIRRMALNPKHLELAEALNNLGFLNATIGYYQDAEGFYLKSLEILKSNQTEESLYANGLRNLAGLYATLGDDSKAEELFLEVLIIHERSLGADHFETAIDLNNLAGVYLRKRDYEKAENTLVRALAIFEKNLGGRRNPFVAAELNNLAGIHAQIGAHSKAETLFRESLQIREAIFSADHPLVAESLNNLADIFRAQRQFEKAKPLYERALSIRDKSFGFRHPLVARSLYSFAVFYMASGDTSTAISLMSDAAEIGETNITRTLAIGSERQKAQYLSTLAEQTDSIVSLHNQFAPQNADALRLAFTTILRRKGRALDAIAGNISSLRRRSSPTDRKLISGWTNSNRQLAARIFRESDVGRPSTPAVLLQIRQLQQQVEDLEAEMSRNSQELKAELKPVTIEDVQVEIPRDTALVEFIRYRPLSPSYATAGNQFGPARYAAYALRNNGELNWAELGDAETIENAITAFRAAVRNTSSDEVNRVSRLLDERVMFPVRKLIGSATRILISPDGALSLIPFDALRDEHGKFLITSYSISYLTTGRDLLRLQLRYTSKHAPVIFADPKFDIDRNPVTPVLAPPDPALKGRRSRDYNEHFNPLLGTAEEGEKITKLFQGSLLLRGRNASEARIKGIRGPRILHVATHGFFLRNAEGALLAESESPSATVLAYIENPLLRSGLAFAGANQRRGGGLEDGILTALEAAALDLRGTKLVALSACETGVGIARTGEGLFGLRRALVLAGSETQILTLWKVDDEVTREMMVHYYTLLKSGQGRSDALRQVRLQMLDGPNKHPYFWSSFVISGDWRVLNAKTAFKK